MVKFHIMMELSMEEDTTFLLLGQKWTEVTASLWPLNCLNSSGSDITMEVRESLFNLQSEVFC